MKSSTTTKQSDSIFLLSCLRCERPFNMTNRVPVLHPCCHESSCMDCWSTKSFVPSKNLEPPQQIFDCFFKCGSQTSFLKNIPIINMAIVRMIDACSTVRLLCDTHPDQPVSCYLIKEGKLACPACISKITPKLVEIDERSLQGTARKLVGLL
jgi:hypothetical protein